MLPSQHPMRQQNSLTFFISLAHFSEYGIDIGDENNQEKHCQ